MTSSLLPTQLVPPIQGKALSSTVYFGAKPASFFYGFQHIKQPVESPPSGDSFSKRAAQPADVAVVLAHPDDELMMSGSLSLLAQKGYSVQLIYLTCGENGVNKNGVPLKENCLGKTRTVELEKAVRSLGVQRAPILLNNTDGGIYQNRADIEAQLTPLLKELSPRLVLTFGPDGLTSHHDHTESGSITDTVVSRMTNPPDTYHVAFTKKADAIFDKIFKFHPDWEGLAPQPDEAISVKVDVASVIDKKLTSLSQHQTQFTQDVIHNFERFFKQFPFETFIKVES